MESRVQKFKNLMASEDSNQPALLIKALIGGSGPE